MKNFFIYVVMFIWIMHLSCTQQSLITNTVSERLITDTAYGSHALQKMDVYLPNNRTANTPLVILIHGGGWIQGDKQDMTPILTQLKIKWPEAAIANINYRLGADTAIHYQEIMQDIDLAVSCLANQSENWQISKNMYMVGASAGGQLAMLYTYQMNSLNYVKAVANYFGPCVLSDWDWYNSFNVWLGQSVKDVLIQYTGSVWNKMLYDSLSPFHRVEFNSKPTILFHGTVDVVVPIYQSQWMHYKLDSLGVPNQYFEYLDFHGFNTTNYSLSCDKMVMFFKAHP